MRLLLLLLRSTRFTQNLESGFINPQHVMSQYSFAEHIDKWLKYVLAGFDNGIGNNTSCEPHVRGFGHSLDSVKRQSIVVLLLNPGRDSNSVNAAFW